MKFYNREIIFLNQFSHLKNFPTFYGCDLEEVITDDDIFIKGIYIKTEKLNKDLDYIEDQENVEIFRFLQKPDDFRWERYADLFKAL